MFCCMSRISLSVLFTSWYNARTLVSTELCHSVNGLMLVLFSPEFLIFRLNDMVLTYQVTQISTEEFLNSFALKDSTFIMQKVLQITMELEDWQAEKVNESVEFLLKMRNKHGRKMDPKDVVEIDIANDISNKNIVIKTNNAIFKESIKGTEFIAILLINQCDRHNLLSELFEAIQPENYRRTFFVDELIANPMANKLVPKYKLCTEKMLRRLLEKYSIVAESLPRIRLRDVAVRWYGWKVGDVVRVKRASGELYYRMVADF